jgi:hypothetical protein
VNLQAQAGTGEGCGPTVVTLQPAAGYQGVITVVLSVGGDELQLANLVAAEGAAGEIIAFDPQPVAAPPIL